MILIVEAQPYFNHRHELTTQHGFLFKADRICVPRALRHEFIEMFHASHLGVEGCLRRARECYFWPLMNAEVKDYVSKCSVCNAMKPEQSREPMIPHEIPNRPWSKVGTDLFEYDSKHYIVMTDYYSNWFEVELLRNTTTREVIREIKKQIARHGLFDELVSDNGPQFTSEEFKEFVKKSRFRHTTSSPHYPLSNGKAENAVKICKQMMKKCQLSNGDVYNALLDFRNTPSAETGYSPAQLMFGRRTRTLLPIPQNKLKPEVKAEINEKITASKRKQAHYYNRSARSLPDLKAGDHVRIKPPGEDHWVEAKCVAKAKEPRSYVVECRGRKYRRNRRQIRATAEKFGPELHDAVELPEMPPKPPESRVLATPRRPWFRKPEFRRGFLCLQVRRERRYRRGLRVLRCVRLRQLLRLPLPFLRARKPQVPRETVLR